MVNFTHRRLYPEKWKRYLLNGPLGLSGRVRKSSPPLGFDPRTFQTVASRYTDWVIPAPNIFTYIPRSYRWRIAIEHLSQQISPLDVRGQRHAPTTLELGRKPRLACGGEPGWAPGRRSVVSILMCRKKKNKHNAQIYTVSWNRRLLFEYFIVMTASNLTTSRFNRCESHSNKALCEFTLLFTASSMTLQKAQCETKTAFNSVYGVCTPLWHKSRRVSKWDRTEGEPQSTDIWGGAFSSADSKIDVPREVVTTYPAPL